MVFTSSNAQCGKHISAHLLHSLNNLVISCVCDLAHGCFLAAAWMLTTSSYTVLALHPHYTIMFIYIIPVNDLCTGWKQAHTLPCWLGPIFLKHHVPPSCMLFLQRPVVTTGSIVGIGFIGYTPISETWREIGTPPKPSVKFPEASSRLPVIMDLTPSATSSPERRRGTFEHLVFFY